MAERNGIPRSDFPLCDRGTLAFELWVECSQMEDVLEEVFLRDYPPLGIPSRQVHWKREIEKAEDIFIVAMAHGDPYCHGDDRRYDLRAREAPPAATRRHAHMSTGADRQRELMGATVGETVEPDGPIPHSGNTEHTGGDTVLERLIKALHGYHVYLRAAMAHYGIE